MTLVKNEFVPNLDISNVSFIGMDIILKLITY